MSALGDARRDVTRLLEQEKLHSDESFRRNEFRLKRWLDALKAWEQEETFDRAFKDDRMTIRGMGVEGKHKEAVDANLKATGTTLKGKELDKAHIHGAVGKFSRPESGVKEMRLHYGVKGVLERMNPENFTPEPQGWAGVGKRVYGRAAANVREAGWSKKYWMGLHDLSACLLTGKRPIPKQRKYYTDSTWVFMPIPKQEDLQLFSCLNAASREDGAAPAFRQYVRMIGSQMTRLKYAESHDMHTTYTDTGGLSSLYPKQGGKIKYGITGIDDSNKITESDIRRRKENALRYKTILSDKEGSDVNEVVVAYRLHGNGKTIFPVFATQVNAESDYVVIDKGSLLPTGPKISIDGEWRPG